MDKLNWGEIRKNKIYWVTNHLIGHIVLKELPEGIKVEFKQLHQTTQERGCKFITSYAQQNEEEDFCECFACYKENAWQLFLTDIQKFRFFNRLTRRNLI